MFMVIAMSTLISLGPKTVANLFALDSRRMWAKTLLLTLFVVGDCENMVSGSQ